MESQEPVFILDWSKGMKIIGCMVAAAILINTASAPDQSANAIFDTQPYTVEHQIASLQLPGLPVTAGETSFKTNSVLLYNLPSATPIPEAYPKESDMVGHQELDCERMAKEAQRKYGGSLVIFAGKDERGQYIQGSYKLHFINRVYVKELGRNQFIDYQLQTVSDKVEDQLFGWAFNMGYPDAEAFILEERSPPFAIQWLY